MARRRSRQVKILQQAAGQEHTSQGETRDVQQGQRSRGIYSASAYFWMYYAPAPQGHQLQRVAPGERAGPGQCHAVLDPAANVDADSVVGSNSTYEFAGIDASQPELLFTKTLTCACPVCRDPTSIALESRGCSFSAFTGRWHQQTVHSTHGVVRVAAEKALSACDFAKRMQSEHLYAVFGSYAERGGRPYWLLRCTKAPYEAPTGLKAHDSSTIRKGSLIFDAQWYASTSDGERRSYKLISDETVHILVKSVVQEADLEFDREGSHDRILGDAAHLKIMRHNFSNVVT